MIVGGGVFAYANELPCSLAWEAFGDANGASTLQEMRDRISRYRKADPNDMSDFRIGCRILTQPFFFDESEFIEVPSSWSPNIVVVKDVQYQRFRRTGVCGMRVNARLVFRQATSMPVDTAGVRGRKPPVCRSDKLIMVNRNW